MRGYPYRKYVDQPRNRVLTAAIVSDSDVSAGAEVSPHGRPQPRLRARGRDDVQIALVPPVQVAVVAQREAQKVQARSRRTPRHHPRFGPVHGQPEVLFERPFEPRHDAWAHPPREHHKVIGVSHQACVRKLGGAVLRMKRAVEVVEVDVGEQG